MDNSTHEIRLAHWREIILQCQNRSQGMTIKQWCSDNSISIKSYYYWQRRVRQQAYDEMKSLPAPTSQQEQNTSVTFAEIPYPVKSDQGRGESFSAVASHPDVVIHTPVMEVGVYNSASDSLISRIFGELRHA